MRDTYHDGITNTSNDEITSNDNKVYMINKNYNQMHIVVYCIVQNTSKL